MAVVVVGGLGGRTFRAWLVLLVLSFWLLGRRPFGSSFCCVGVSIGGIERWEAHCRIQSGIALACESVLVNMQDELGGEGECTNDPFHQAKLARLLLDTHGGSFAERCLVHGQAAYR
jgi:hypothetical protein